MGYLGGVQEYGGVNGRRGREAEGKAAEKSKGAGFCF